MSELIDREATVKQICKIGEMLGGRAKDVVISIALFVQDDKTAFPTISIPVAELDTTKDFAQWIPCSERLPDKLGDYLVTDIRGNVYCSTLDYVLKEKYFGYDDDGYFVKDDTVVAWMPLPKPYKKEGEAE